MSIIVSARPLDVLWIRVLPLTLLHQLPIQFLTFFCLYMLPRQGFSFQTGSYFILIWFTFGSHWFLLGSLTGFLFVLVWFLWDFYLLHIRVLWVPIWFIFDSDGVFIWFIFSVHGGSYLVFIWFILASYMVLLWFLFGSFFILLLFIFLHIWFLFVSYFVGGWIQHNFPIILYQTGRLVLLMSSI